MKKFLIIFILATIFLGFLLVIAAIIASFTIVKPATEQVNQKLVQKFEKVVHIPEGIPPPIRGFEETVYFWEMETPQNEVGAVRFRYTPGFSKNQSNIEAVLEMPQGGDPSIFNKFLPAIIADERSLKSALDPDKADLSPNEEVGYQQIKILLTSQTKQTVTITWVFEKATLGEVSQEYDKLAKIPAPLLKVLHSLPHLILGLLSA